MFPWTIVSLFEPEGWVTDSREGGFWRSEVYRGKEKRREQRDSGSREKYMPL